MTTPAETSRRAADEPPPFWARWSRIYVFVFSLLLVALHGKGRYIYTGLAFFRQLPAGVPGAARLFVNLLAAGGAAAPRAQ